jgi:hypothetical protein
MAVLITLGVLSMLMVTITWQIVANRRVLERRQNQAQATWLARSGIELGAAHLLASAAYTGEVLEIIPEAKVDIQVERIKETPDAYVIISEARYPSEGTGQVVRSVTRHFRRVMEKGKVQLVPAEGKTG